MWVFPSLCQQLCAHWLVVYIKPNDLDSLIIQKAPNSQGNQYLKQPTFLNKLSNTQIWVFSFSWVLFNRYVATGQVDNDLLDAADSQLAEVAKDAKTTKDPAYAKILNSTLTAMLGWAEKRLLAYHDTFDAGNIESMPTIVSIGVSAARILVEDISNEYRRRRKGEVDVARSRIDTYIRSSLRTAFAQASSIFF